MRDRTRRGSARTASATVATDAACRSRGAGMPRRTGSARPVSRGCRSPPSGRASPATRSGPTRRRRCRSTAHSCSQRRLNDLGAGTVEWLGGFGTDAVAFRNGNVTVVANIGSSPIQLPDGIVIAASGPLGRSSSCPRTRPSGSREAENRAGAGEGRSEVTTWSASMRSRVTRASRRRPSRAR